MSFLPFSSRTCEKVELRPKHCIDTILKPFFDNIGIKINGQLSSKDLFYTAICMAVDKSSVHSASKHYQEIPCETSLRYHLRKLSLEELIQANQSILLHSSVSTLKPEKKYEFAIESSYRMRNIVKPRTSTKDVTFRYFFTILSFLLRNVWIYLQKKHFTIVKPGPITIDEDKFRFARFILFVEEWLRRKLRIQLVVQCLR